MAQVWVVLYCYWSGDENEDDERGILGVYSSNEKAQAARRRYDAKNINRGDAYVQDPVTVDAE